MKRDDFIRAMNNLNLLVDCSNGEHKVKDKNGILVALVGLGYGMVDTDRSGFYDLSGKDRKIVAETALEFALTETEHRIHGRFYRVEFQRTDKFVCLLRRENNGIADICYDMRAVELSEWYKFKEDEVKAIDERYLEFMVEA